MAAQSRRLSATIFKLNLSLDESPSLDGLFFVQFYTNELIHGISDTNSQIGNT